MIKLGDTYLNLLGLKIKQISGLFDFTKLKNEGIEWNDRDFNEALLRNIYYQYESRQITLDCFVAADNWTALQSRLNSISSALKFDGLRMLKVSGYSNRGYMVRLKKTTVFQPKRYFQARKSVAAFKIVFEEPQPFNVQFSIINLTTSVVKTNTAITISNADKSLSFGSDEQKYITVNFMGVSEEVNLEQENYEFNTLTTFGPGIYEPLVITGEIDNMTNIGITIDSSLTLIGTDTADFFLRNGSITV
jgi:hypothetical protein